MPETLLIAIQAIVQGITEFLPISSSAHLILVWNWFDNPFNPEQQLALDVALHVGTLVAVVAFFWRDVLDLIAGGFDILLLKNTPKRAYALNILVATIPIILVGFLAKDLITTFARQPLVIAFTTIFFGALLWWSDKVGKEIKRDQPLLSLKEAALVGIAQVFALIPGTSRSGVTMTAARFFGVERVEAARFALLLSIPTILGAGVLSGLDLTKAENLDITGLAILSAVLSAIVAYFAIWVMVGWLKTKGFLPFVIYRFALGALLLYFFL